jgi:hypothetical protein
LELGPPLTVLPVCASSDLRRFRLPRVRSPARAPRVNARRQCLTTVTVPDTTPRRQWRGCLPLLGKVRMVSKGRANISRSQSVPDMTPRGQWRECLPLLGKVRMGSRRGPHIWRGQPPEAKCTLCMRRGGAVRLLKQEGAGTRPTPSRRCRLRCSASRRLSARRRVRPSHLPEQDFRPHRRPMRAARVRARPENWIAVPVLNALGNCVVVLPERRSASSVNSLRSGRETGPYVQ